MQLARLLILGVAAIVAFGGYVVEGRRLKVIERLSGAQGRALYEARQHRDRRVMWVLTLALFTAAVTSVVAELAQRAR